MGKQLSNSVVLSLLLITSLSMLAYLPLIPFLGFYSDDFFFAYVSHFFGITGIMDSLVVDRPFNGYLLAFNSFLLGLGDNIFFWHVYIFLMRLLGGYLLFFSLQKIWPNKLSIITSITLLFLVYPGYLRQTLPLGFVGWTTNLTIWITSLAFTVLATYQKSKFKSTFFTLIAIFLQLNSFLQLEFFIGMEVFRVLIITLILKKTISLRSIIKTLAVWLPYIISLAIFVLWRIFGFKGTREATDISWVAQTYYSDPQWILNIPLEIVHSFVQTVLFAYLIPPLINFIRLPIQYSIVALSLGIFSGVIMHYYFKKIKNNNNDRKFGKQLYIIGLVSIMAALIPEILAGRVVRIFNVFDRYTLTSIIGVAFIIVGFLLSKFRRNLFRWAFIILIVTSITSHLMNGFWHKITWDKQNNLWWQLYWRAPNIQNNTMLILDFPPITRDIPFKDIINKVKWYRFYWAEEQIWTEGNLFFNYNNPPSDHFRGDFLRDKDILKKIKENTIETFNNRNIIYTRNFKNIVIVTVPSDNSCLWVLDNKQNEFPANSDDLLKSSIKYSNVNNLIGKKTFAIPPSEIFGKEPIHEWCYFFQKAQFARQTKDWNKLSQLKEEVVKKNLKPKDPNEWLPFEKNLR